MKNVQSVKLFVAMVVTTAFIFSFSHFGVNAYERIFSTKEGYAEGTTVGGVDISGMSLEEALKVLKDSQKEWLQSTSIKLKYKEKTVDFATDLFTFQFQESLEKIHQGTDNSLIVSLNQDDLIGLLYSISPYLIEEDVFSVNKWNDSLIAIASQLDKGNHELALQEYLVSQKEEEVILTDTTLEVKENKKNVAKWVKQFPSIKVGQEETVSLLDIMGKQTDSYSDTTLSMVATALHQLVLTTNFTITERFISNQLPNYAQLGYEAKINQSKKMDYRFYNPNAAVYQLQFKMSGNKLYASIVGVPFLFKYDVVLSDQQAFKPKTVIRFDSLLGFNEYRTVSEGTDGLLIKVYRLAKNDDGVEVKKDLMSEDFYPPINKVVASGLIKEQETVIDTDNVEDSLDLNDPSDSEENIKEEEADTDNPTTDNPPQTESDNQHVKEDEDKEETPQAVIEK